MYKNLLSWLTVLLVLPSCSGTSPAISVVCEENNIGNCIIKWETTPILKGQVKVYTSTSPEIIPEDSSTFPYAVVIGGIAGVFAFIGIVIRRIQKAKQK